MSSTRQERQRLLKELLERGEERPDLDYKQDLHLDNRGDKAEFVKDVLALANSSETGYIVTGVEDKTWKPVGISEHHAQTKLNSVLKGKTDPRIEVQYVELELDGVEHGIVTINADNPPYLVAVADRYGGRVSTSPRKEVYITRGTVYVRIQDQNDGASRSHLDEIYRGRENHEREADADWKHFLEEEVRAMQACSLDGGASGILVMVRARGPSASILDRLIFPQDGFQQEFRRIVLNQKIEPAGACSEPDTVPRPRGIVAREESVEVRWEKFGPIATMVLKMHDYGHGTLALEYRGENDRIDYFAAKMLCGWFFKVVGKLYGAYDTGGSIGEVEVSVRLRSFSQKLLCVSRSRDFPECHQYTDEEDPRTFPRKPLVVPVSELRQQPAEVAESLLQLVLLSYRHL
jgi:hypothetical protein